jgi:hypothetical protein
VLGVLVVVGLVVGDSRAVEGTVLGEAGVDGPATDAPEHAAMRSAAVATTRTDMFTVSHHRLAELERGGLPTASVFFP